MRQREWAASSVATWLYRACVRAGPPSRNQEVNFAFSNIKYCPGLRGRNRSMHAACLTSRFPLGRFWSRLHWQGDVRNARPITIMVISPMVAIFVFSNLTTIIIPHCEIQLATLLWFGGETQTDNLAITEMLRGSNYFCEVQTRLSVLPHCAFP